LFNQFQSADTSERDYKDIFHPLGDLSRRLELNETSPDMYCLKNNKDSNVNIYFIKKLNLKLNTTWQQFMSKIKKIKLNLFFKEILFLFSEEGNNLFSLQNN